jgi:hypothetical protein
LRAKVDEHQRSQERPNGSASTKPASRRAEATGQIKAPLAGIMSPRPRRPGAASRRLIGLA